MRVLALGLAALAAIACGPGAGGQTSVPADVFAGRPYAQGPASSSTKVFLVAGGTDVANFAAEVLEQRTLWRRAGLREDEIACYWAKPTERGWADDHAQYQELETALRSCREATPARLAADLRVAAKASPDFVYLYISSHGLPSQLRSLEASKSRATARFVDSLSAAERDVLDPPAIALDAGEGPALGEARGVVRALRAGASPSDVVFTPTTLGPLLQAFPEQTRKVVVLQACFSGGFIDHHIGGEVAEAVGANVLLSTPGLTVLTATAAERPSFGCGSGEARTYFGGAYNKALERALLEHAPESLPWRSIYEDVVFAVEVMESIKGQRASVPGFVRTPYDSGGQPASEAPSAS